MSFLLDTNTVSEISKERPSPGNVSLIEAIALSHELTVATHNSSDFFRVRTLDPWTGG